MKAEILLQTSLSQGYIKDVNPTEETDSKILGDLMTFKSLPDDRKYGNYVTYL